MGGKHNKCCCEECYTFLDNFDRSDSTDLGSDWTECSGSWEIDTNRLTETTLSGVVVLNHMVGNPVGLLSAIVDVDNCVGAVYRVYCFFGSLGTPCGSAGTYYVEITITDVGEGIIEIVGGTGDFSGPVTFETGEGYLDFTVCVSTDTIEVITDARKTNNTIARILECDATPDNYWFALGSGGSVQGYWLEVDYSDHYDHNPNCPTCTRSACFQLYNEVIAGFTISLYNRADGDDCTCGASGSYDIFVGAGQDRCEGELSGSENIDEPDSGCPADWTWTMECDPDTGIHLTLTIQPTRLGAGDFSFWTADFAIGTDPADVVMVAKLATDGSDHRDCDDDLATATMTPILAESCCGDP
mgnify:CR=1 FL=1